MKRILVRADDLGYSEAVNYGISKTIHEGIIRSVGVMVNMDATEHGLALLGDAQVCFGLHTNICVGRPVSDPTRIPSLVDSAGTFWPSKAFCEASEDFIALDEVVIEIEAQYQRFCELVGHEPEYFEGHAVRSEAFFSGLELVAARHGCAYLPFIPDGPAPFKNSVLHPGFTEAMLSDGDARQMADRFVARLEETLTSNTIEQYICHPGYLDAYLVEHSSLTTRRMYEVELACDLRVKRFIEEHGVHVVTYGELD